MLLLPATTNSLVIGLYGKWGEGKSTVLHFVEHELKRLEPHPVVIHLNPWRFPQEEQLLLDFFNQLASSLGKSLKKKGERFAEAVTKYAAPMIPTFSLGVASTDVGKSLQAFGGITQPGIEELYQRVNHFIAEAKCRVVVVVDDIDRLEKQQIQAVFRLVKLTANFSNTAYLLAFDEEMVARAIGEVFTTSPNAQSDGRSFLEKIIQFPLRLPRARSSDLLTFCLARVYEALQENDIQLDAKITSLHSSQPNAERFAQAFRQGVIPRLTTPRVAIRYANAVRFSVPLLLDEINPVDLLLVEAINIFYPEVHSYVATHQDVFTSQNLQILRTLGGGAETNAELEGALTNIFADHHYTLESQAAVRTLLKALFPKLVILANNWVTPLGDSDTLDDGALERRRAITSPRYFSRYFSYSVASDDVTDQEFNAFLQADGANQLGQFRNLTERLGVPSALTRIEYRFPDLSEGQHRALFTCLTNAAGLYCPPRSWDEVTNGEMSQAIKLVLHLLASLPGANEQVTTAQQLNDTPGSFEFAYLVNQRLHQQFEQRPSFWQPALPKLALAPSDWKQVLASNAESLLRRALREADSTCMPLYRSKPFWARKLMLTIWPKLNVSPGPAAYILPFLQKNPTTEVVAFLEACGDLASGNDAPFYLTGLGVNTFDQLRTLFGRTLYELARSQFGLEPVEGVDFRETEEPTPRQRLRQFIWLFENRHMPEPSAVE